jgi:2-polyprenyl-6-methoxyphenol hydroxylase-like FAD-dependent oxidoreductase
MSDGEGLQADLVVACDGRASLARRCAGLDLAETTPTIDVLWFRLKGPGGEALATHLAQRFHTVIGDEGSLALFASAGGGVQLGWPRLDRAGTVRSTRDWRDLWLRLCPAELGQALAAVPLEAIEGPLRLPVRVGLAGRWWRPGLLLLGDAAHPMSPLRAQGTAMALRDVVAAAALLPAALKQPSGPCREAALEGALMGIEALRRPEIERMQALQQQEWQRGERLGHNPGLRRLLACLAPGLAPILAVVWQRSQGPLRQGLAGALPPHTAQAAMMEPASAAR